MPLWTLFGVCNATTLLCTLHQNTDTGIEEEEEEEEEEETDPVIIFSYYQDSQLIFTGCLG